jgi:phage repressor protein C with HTH and peptisase S24 domain
MKYSELLPALQNLIGRRPSAKEISDILNFSSEKVYYTRAQRDSSFTFEEIDRIQEHYAINLLGNVNDNITLDFYPDVFGSCGSGCMVFSEAKEKLAVTKDIITNYSASNQYSIISARGSSMSPTINDEDKLVIQHNLNEQIIDDTVYLFRYNDELFIKRLVKNVDQIVCISENPRFQDRIIEPKGDNFSIIGKVVGLFRSKV